MAMYRGRTRRAGMVLGAGLLAIGTAAWVCACARHDDGEERHAAQAEKARAVDPGGCDEGESDAGPRHGFGCPNSKAESKFFASTQFSSYAAAHGEHAQPLGTIVAGGGRVAEIKAHRVGGVVTAWLNNGVCVHHRFMPASAAGGMGSVGSGEVEVCVSFVGGELLETAASRGVGLAATTAWRWPVLAGRSQAQTAKLLESARVSLSGESNPDALVLHIQGEAGDLRAASPLIAELIARPIVDADALGADVSRAVSEVRARARSAQGIVAESLVDLVFPKGDARTRFLTPEQVGAHDVKEAQAWLDASVADSRVEASIVGDISLDEALRLGESLFAQLPTRARITPNCYAALRELPRPVGPVEGAYARPTGEAGGRAFVVAGFFGADVGRTDDLLALAVASRVLSARLKEAAPAGITGVEDLSSTSIPSRVYPGFGMVLAAATVEPGSAGAIAELLNTQIQRLGEWGPSEDEVRRVTAVLGDAATRSTQSPRYWAGLLSRCHTRGIDPDECEDPAGKLRAMTAGDVREVLGRYCRPETMIRMTIMPEGE